MVLRILKGGKRGVGLMYPRLAERSGSANAKRHQQPSTSAR
jgi:hypothetical protein